MALSTVLILGLQGAKGSAALDIPQMGGRGNRRLIE